MKSKSIHKRFADDLDIIDVWRFGEDVQNDGRAWGVKKNKTKKIPYQL